MSAVAVVAGAAVPDAEARAAAKVVPVVPAAVVPAVDADRPAAG